MKTAAFNGDRLKHARLFRALTLTELAGKTGISKQSLSLYENMKEGKVDFEKAQTIASALSFPVHYFFHNDNLKIATEVTYFRSLVSATKMDRISQIIKLEDVTRMYEALLGYIDFPMVNLPDVDFTGTDDEFDDTANIEMQRQIERIAQNLREFWSVGNTPITNLQLLLEKNGIIVTGFDTFEKKIDAFSQRTTVSDKENFIIALSLGHCPEGRILFDMAHELGHILLHPWSESPELITKEEFKSREKQANMFASAFLLPDNGFGNELREYSAYVTDLSFYKTLKKKWRTSIQAMLYRANQLEIISSNQFQYLMRQISKNGWRTKEHGDEPYFLNENIFQGAIDLLLEERILTVNSLLRVFESYGVNLFKSDIEILLNLREGTLATPEKAENIIQLKRVNE
ncbi:XRE family transcriptional regulator [Proteiniclasticum sp. QWL-01]|uniref:helix-turn-helix domain-containing protein n=1 Tax=Proteiniclasticum sp. QWL-01 TaxID=3036945 RepID=UPI00240F6F77|nr:XRE family transcriptional regulator [Proteiniclasticum sp. QWL-01]WFF72263.1 XRE family transcriptional regulator [Proteiniclasticum sp. QWL-01]